MKLTCTVLVLFSCAILGHAYPNRRGICLTFCGINGRYSCPSGYSCQSNGCGHECYRSADYQLPAGCTTLSCAGQSHCPLGYKVDTNGCDTCECDYSAFQSNTHVG